MSKSGKLTFDAIMDETNKFWLYSAVPHFETDRTVLILNNQAAMIHISRYFQVDGALWYVV